jgi:hypothetical protein
MTRANTEQQKHFPWFAKAGAACSIVPISRFVGPHIFALRGGGYPTPCGSALFCFGFAALRVTVSVYDGPSANAELGTWEPGPLARLCRE